jgi:flagellar hook protein FlgE
MLTALSTALSALNAQSTAIDVVGNNLANLNTTGFKAQSTEFHDLVSQTMGGGTETQVGMGVGTPITARVFSEGSVQSTSNPLDVAIQGNGFLVTKGASGGTLYTRAGNLKQDANGTLTDANGNFIQGWSSVNGAISTSTAAGNITIPQGSLSAPVATQNISLSANLNSSATAPATPTASNASLSQVIPVYDSLGNSHSVTLNFWPGSTSGAWNWQATVPGSDVGSSSATSVVGSGSMTFNSAGQLTSPAAGSAAPTLTISGLADGANSMTVNFNMYKGTTPTITQFAQSSASSSNSADGSAAGQLTGVAIATGGNVVATYSNGKQVTVAQLAMANFTNPDSLLAVGNNSYQTTGSTSNPSIGLANTGGRGQIEGSSLESSTADIATEFTNLMVDQRSYEANSKVVTTADQLNNAVINLIH